jgi:predicted MPP superfamily phosphohydrolase
MSTAKSIDARLAQRVHPTHLRLRLGIERHREAHTFGQGRNFFHIENSPVLGLAVEWGLRLTLLAGRARRNTVAFQVTENTLRLPALPPAFEGLTILQLSDLHLDIDTAFPAVLSEAVHDLEYDLCVLTGDFRYRTFGPWKPAMDALRRVRTYLSGPIYAVLGNHDSIEMVPDLEDLGIRVLLNECVPIERPEGRIHLAGIDDPHYYCTDNIERACHDVPADEVSLLLAHSPEIYRQAAHAGFDAMLCGHTHGGQIRLPGGIALMCNADCPRRFCAGRWRYADLQGYTSLGTGSSVAQARFNCPPEITLHRLVPG